VLNREVIACVRCPRLVAYREQIAREERKAYRDWEYWGKPVPGFGDPKARVLVLGLAPGAHGSNRTGRPFTGDASGNFMYPILHETGFANQLTTTDRKLSAGGDSKNDGAFGQQLPLCIREIGEATPKLLDQAETVNLPHFEIGLVLVRSRSRCQRHRKRGSQHHVNGCSALRSRSHYLVRHTTADRMAAPRKLD